jgi:hypothetical protein
VNYGEDKSVVLVASFHKDGKKETGVNYFSYR